MTSKARCSQPRTAIPAAKSERALMREREDDSSFRPLNAFLSLSLQGRKFILNPSPMSFESLKPDITALDDKITSEGKKFASFPVD